MAESKGMKWIIGVSGVLAFTGFLYLTQKANSGPGVMAERRLPDPRVAGDQSGVDSGPAYSDAEVFLFETEKLERIQNGPPARKSDRERLLESLNWDDDPDAEMTVPPLTDGIGRKSTGSNLRTRRS